MYKKEKIRRIQGITLVSLVVTIIVLIILAGVSINLTLGENGIITMATKARENMELAKTDEETQLNELYMQMEQEGLSGEISYDAITKLIEFKREIASAITDMGINTPENADASTMSSNIRSLTGASSADKVSYDNTNSSLSSTNVQGAVDELDSEIYSLNDSLDGSLLIKNIIHVPVHFENVEAGKYSSQTVDLTSYGFTKTPIPLLRGVRHLQGWITTIYPSEMNVTCYNPSANTLSGYIYYTLIEFK